MAAGLLILVLGPLFALAGTHHGSARKTPPASAGEAFADATESALLQSSSLVNYRLLRPRDPSLSEPTPTATPPPPPPRPPTPTAKPRPRAAAVVPPLPSSPPPRPGTIKAIIYAAAQRYGVSYPWMLSIAECESSLNPRSYNPVGPYYGLFQFLMSTFRAHGGTNIWDPTQQANIAAWMLAHGGANAWGCA